MTDPSLISSILSGDSRGYSVLLKRYRSRLYFFINGMVFDKMDAEDLTMIAFEKAFSKLDKWNEDSCKFSTWLFTIARNTVIDFIRSNEKKLLGGEDVSKYIALHDQGYTPEEQFIHAENVMIIENCINKLSKRRKELIYLHIDGNKDEQIAEILNKNYQAVRSQLFNTRNQLKSLLYEENNPYINCLIA